MLRAGMFVSPTKRTRRAVDEDVVVPVAAAQLDRWIAFVDDQVLSRRGLRPGAEPERGEGGEENGACAPALLWLRQGGSLGRCLRPAVATAGRFVGGSVSCRPAGIGVPREGLNPLRVERASPKRRTRTVGNPCQDRNLANGMLTAPAAAGHAPPIRNCMNLAKDRVRKAAISLRGLTARGSCRPRPRPACAGAAGGPRPRRSRSARRAPGPADP